MEDFKARLEKISKRNSKKKHEVGKHWPMEKKVEVVSQYLVIGNLRQVAAITGVSYDVVRTWRTQPWWPELERELRQTQNIEMDTKLSKIVDKSLDAVLDRVENGDFIFDQKAQELRRKPVALRDVHRVAVDTVTKRELLRGNATERKETTQISVKEQLSILALEFAKWNSKTKEVIDVEMVEIVEVNDAVHDQWAPGLQEGTEMGAPTPEEGEGSGTEESGPESL